MLVNEIMTEQVVTVAPEETVAVAARMLSRGNVGALPVCTADGRLRGMLTDRDLVLRCMAADKNAGSVRVGSVMTGRIVSAQAGMDVSQAAALMAKEQVRRLPVTEQGRLVGLVTLADLSRRDEYAAEAGECLGEICAAVHHLD